MPTPVQAGPHEILCAGGYNAGTAMLRVARDGEAWNAYSYRWNDAGTDAELVPAEGAERKLRAAPDRHALGGGSREYTWRYQSRAECLRCHSVAQKEFEAMYLENRLPPNAAFSIPAGKAPPPYFKQ